MDGRAVATLRIWAGLGERFMAPRPKGVSWEPARRLIRAASAALAVEAARLRVLLEESRRRLAPLDDPLEVDLGLHRWLGEEREEAYSDWLQWVLQQVDQAELVFGLFRLPPPTGCGERGAPEVRREAVVPEGHAGHGGRLDIVVRYPSQAILLIEVKKGSADAADTAKHAGYKRWLDQQPERYREGVVLGTTAEDERYEEFRFHSWAELCVRLRRMVPELRDRGKRLTVLALILAFVGAVEQNLLGFSSELVREIVGGQAPLFNAKVVDHFTEVLR